MTGSIRIVYEQFYKNQWIRITELSQSAPGGPSSYSLDTTIDGYSLPSNFDGCSHNPFRPSEDTDNRLTQEELCVLVLAAKAYCDREAEALERRGNELLSLTLSYREAKTLLRAIQECTPTTRRKAHDLPERIEVLLQSPYAVRLTRLTNLLGIALTKIYHFVDNRQR